MKLRIEYIDDYDESTIYEKDGSVETAEDVIDSFRYAMMAFGFAPETVLEYMPREYLLKEEYAQRVDEINTDYEYKLAQLENKNAELKKFADRLMKDNAVYAENIKKMNMFVPESHVDYLKRIADVTGVDWHPGNGYMYPIDAITNTIRLMREEE